MFGGVEYREEPTRASQHYLPNADDQRQPSSYRYSFRLGIHFHHVRGAEKKDGLDIMFGNINTNTWVHSKPK